MCNGVGFVETVPANADVEDDSKKKDDDATPVVSDEDVQNATKPDSEFLAEVVAAINEPNAKPVIENEETNLNNAHKEDSDANEIPAAEENNEQDDIEKPSDNKLTEDEIDEPEL